MSSGSICFAGFTKCKDRKHMISVLYIVEPYKIGNLLEVASNVLDTTYEKGIYITLVQSDATDMDRKHLQQ